MTNPRVRLSVRRQVRERAAFRCEYCLSPELYIPDRLVIEHIIPRALEGDDALENLALSCQRCNALKSVFIEAYDPLTQKLAPLYHPRRDRWAKHFCWSEDFLTLVGLTPIGRATIERLQLNRGGVVNLRSLLLLTGKHPPISE